MSVTPWPSYSGRTGFELINEIALKVAISGSILPIPDVCLVIVIALPRGSTLAFPTHQAIKAWLAWVIVLSASLRSNVLIAPVSRHPCDTPTTMPASGAVSIP